jgi:PadR family transcriptional regulator AphA
MSPRLPSTPYAILGLLSFAPMSGYDIRKEVVTSIGYFWSESFGQIYPALRDLAGRGFIRRRAGAGPRERQVYEITARGRKALRQWQADPPRPGPLRNELLLKLFFGAPGRVDNEIAWLEQRRVEESSRLRVFRDLRRQLLDEQRDHPSLPFWLATLSYGEHHSRAVLRWTRETLTTLRGLPGEAPKKDTSR